MIKTVRRAGASVVAATMVVAVVGVLGPTHRAGAATSWQTSASINPSSTTDFASGTFQQSLRNLQADGADEVTLVVPYYQSTDSSSDIQAGGNTPTDASLEAGINYAHSLGMRVTLSLHDDPYTGDWRADINASDRTTWFTNYGNVLTHLGVIAQATGVEEICIGTEMIDMASTAVNASNGPAWITMIDNLKAVYTGQLTYAAQRPGNGWTEANSVSFWPLMNQIGIDAYYPVGTTCNDSVADMESSWNQIDASDLEPLYQQYGKQILFTEVGYQSTSCDNMSPWVYTGGSYDGTDQANEYEALFQTFSGKSDFAGISIWDWSSDPTYGGTYNTDFTPYGKPAEAVLKQWYSANSAPGGVPGPQQVTLTCSPASTATTGQALQVPVKATVTNPVSGAIVDVEVYDSSGQQAYQQYFSGQNLSAGVPDAVTATWTPSTAGTYTVKLGLFTSGWASELSWNNAAATVAVTTTAPPTTVPPTTVPPTTTPPTTTPPTTTPPTTTPPTTVPASSPSLSVWWPTNGADVSGVQPFKALLNGVSLNSYNMYWQVGTGQLNLMGNNSAGGDHKESSVDLSGWTWQPNDQYTVTFVAKDLNGNTLGSQSVVITVG